ncbi:HNH endonuclease [Streptomyces sp. NPDC056202]|uniref:HNH endonuclease n=1 Tax=Streptomyces sp. NPDC056202 TaxID=3345745 RepID=UPI0035D60A50
MADATVPRGSRTKQATYVWLMSLTANEGLCTYCAVKPSTTLDHQQPVAGNGADVWWNFLPACKPCNDWKRGRSPMEWLIDQKLHREHPRDGFDTRKMPLRMFAGFETRIERVRREIADPDRRDWFRHHFGAARYKNKGDIWGHLELCRKTLDRYPHLPWKTPSVDPSESDVCTRRICCGWRHPDSRTVRGVIMGRSEYAAISQAAFESDMSVGDLTATLLIRHLRDRHNEMPNNSHMAARTPPSIPTQRS